MAARKSETEAKKQATTTDTKPKRVRPPRRRHVEGVGPFADTVAFWRLWLMQPGGVHARVEVDDGTGKAIGVWPIDTLSIDTIRQLVPAGSRVKVGYLDVNQRPAGNSIEIPILPLQEAHEAEVIEDEEDRVLARVERVQNMVQARATAENEAINAKAAAQIAGLKELAQVFAPQRASADDRVIALLDRMDQRLAKLEAQQAAPQQQPQGPLMYDPATGQVYQAVVEQQPVQGQQPAQPAQHLPFTPGVPFGDQLGAAVGNLVYTSVENLSKSETFQRRIAEKIAEHVINSGAVQVQAAPPEPPHVNGAAKPEGT